MDINQAFPSKYLKASDFPVPRHLTIRAVTVEDIDDDGTKKPVMYFNEGKMGLVLNKTNGLLVAHHYSNETDAWINKPLELYKDTVQFQGRVVDCIRVRVPQAAPPAAPAAQAPAQPYAPPPTDDDIPF